MIHKRRPRYKGKFPRKFEEKYKELSDSFTEDKKKIVARGATLAGTHRPIMVEEIMKILNPVPGERAVDATLGYGGHAEVLLKKLSPDGYLIGFDQDPIERPKTEARLRALQIPTELEVIGSNFREVRKFLKKPVDLILADLGLSSMQIDDPKRGFSFKVDGDFDLRMNPNSAVPAYKALADLTEEQLTKILREYSDEPHARQIAHALKKRSLRKTKYVAQTINEVVKTFSKKVQEKEGDTPVRRVFQALRIHVNDEFNALEEFLESLPQILKPRGRVCILSFHSGEDRRVKKSLQWGFRNGIYSAVAEDFIRASITEQRDNPRSKSAKLRWAIRK